MRLLISIIPVLFLSTSFANVENPSLVHKSLCRSESFQPSNFWQQHINPEKVDRNIKIRKKCIETNVSKFDSENSVYDGYVLDVELGELTQTEFFKLKEQFGNFSRVPYRYGKNYNLIDFLPPAMQAMVNKNFRARYYDEFNQYFNQVDNEILSWEFKNGMSSSANCWNTVIENLRLMANPFQAGTGPYNLYWPGRWEVSESLFDDSYSQQVSREDAKFGDVVLIYLEEQHLRNGEVTYVDKQLQHASMVLNDQLVYEKIDSSSLHPYRIALFDETFNKIKSLFGEDLLNDEWRKQSLKVEIRRFDLAKFAASEYSKPSDHDFTRDDNEDWVEEEYEEVYKEAVKLLPPAVKDLYLTLGCETGMGGGCQTSITVLQRVRVKIDQDSGMGYLEAITTPDEFTNKYSGGTQAIERFTEVLYLN